MRKQIRVLLPQMLLTLGALIAYMPDSFAQGSYGATVDSECLAFNGTQPYAAYQLTPEGMADKCSFCHQPKPISKATRKDPEWTWWQNQFTQITNFCPPQTNQAPDSVITAPANNTTINIGTSLAFIGTGSDPDNNTPLTYAWDFGGAAANSTAQNPTVVFNSVGTFTINFTVTDSLGRADPTPAQITLIVNDPNANQAPNGIINTPIGNVAVNVSDSVSFSGTGNDPDNNTPLTYQWNFGGGASNSTLQNPTVTFNTAGIYSVTLTVTDNKGLSDPTPATRTVTVGTVVSSCSDQDNDMFSPDGGICGPIDCNDFDAAINPGAIEACGDGFDNDCNGDIDDNDAHCKGADCLGQLLNRIEIASATWDLEESELKVKGYWSTEGAVVELSDAITGTVLGTTTVKLDDDYEEEHDSEEEKIFEWKFEFEHLAIVPCRVHVDIEGGYGERDVAYAPADCSGKPPAVNNPPVANDDSATTTQQIPVQIMVLANDTDIDEDKLSILVFTQPEHGVVTREDDILIYSPKSEFIGNDSFTYIVSDGHGGTATATVSVTVEKAQSNPINVKIDTATWNRKDRKLIVKGSGAPSKASVKILNAATNAIIGTTETEDDGKWKKVVEKPANVPCKIRVEITKDAQTGYAEKNVRSAPKTCQ